MLKKRLIQFSGVLLLIVFVLSLGYYFYSIPVVDAIPGNLYTGPKVDYYHLPTPKKEEFFPQSYFQTDIVVHLDNSPELVEANKKIFKCYGDDDDGNILKDSQLLKKHNVRLYRGFPYENGIFLHYRCLDTKLTNFFILQPGRTIELDGNPTIVDNVVAWTHYDDENERVPVTLFKSKDGSLIKNQFVAVGEQAKKILTWHPAFQENKEADFSSEMEEGFSKHQANLYFSIPTKQKNFIIENWSKRVDLEYTVSICTNILFAKNDDGKYIQMNRDNGGDCDHGESFNHILGILNIQDADENEDWLASVGSGSEDESVELTPLTKDGKLDRSKTEDLLFNQY